MKSALPVVLLLFLACAVVAAPGESPNNTVITSKRMTFDYKRLVAEFSGNVVVVDPQIRIESDDLTMVFSGTNQIKTVTAIGNVRIKQVDKTATANKAIYFAREGKVLLVGNARVLRGTDSVNGEEITYWFNEERMTVKGGSKLTIISDKPRQGGGLGLENLAPR